MKCLEKDRSRRYETANGLARDVEHYLHDEPVEACPPSAGYQLRKFARKYRMPVIVVAAFTLLLVAGVVVSAWTARLKSGIPIAVRWFWPSPEATGISCLSPSPRTASGY
jgi:hypothetical protein